MCTCTHTDRVQVNISMYSGCYGSTLTCACWKEERVREGRKERKGEKREVEMTREDRRKQKRRAE